MENKEIILWDNSEKEEFINNFIDEFFQAEWTSVYWCFGDCWNTFNNKNLCWAWCKKIKKLNEEEIIQRKSKLKLLAEKLYKEELKNISNLSLKNYLLKEYFKNIIKNILDDKRKKRVKKEL